MHNAALLYPDFSDGMICQQGSKHLDKTSSIHKNNPRIWISHFSIFLEENATKNRSWITCKKKNHPSVTPTFQVKIMELHTRTYHQGNLSHHLLTSAAYGSFNWHLGPNSYSFPAWTNPNLSRTLSIRSFSREHLYLVIPLTSNVRLLCYCCQFTDNQY